MDDCTNRAAYDQVHACWIEATADIMWLFDAYITTPVESDASPQTTGEMFPQHAPLVFMAWVAFQAYTGRLAEV